jgi:hypothetical protein
MSALHELRVRLMLGWGREDNDMSADEIRASIELTLDEFEEEHPGLIDRTRYCSVCNNAIFTDYMKWQSFDPSTKWKCSRCAEE